MKAELILTAKSLRTFNSCIFFVTFHVLPFVNKLMFTSCLLNRSTHYLISYRGQEEKYHMSGTWSESAVMVIVWIPSWFQRHCRSLLGHLRVYRKSYTGSGLESSTWAFCFPSVWQRLSAYVNCYLRQKEQITCMMGRGRWAASYQ